MPAMIPKIMSPNNEATLPVETHFITATIVRSL